MAIHLKLLNSLNHVILQTVCLRVQVPNAENRSVPSGLKNGKLEMTKIHNNLSITIRINPVGANGFQ